MLKLSAITNKGIHKLNLPESWEECSVEQFQKIIHLNDNTDWIGLFSILSGLQTIDIETSRDYRLETALYQSIEFVFDRSSLEKLPIPETLELRPIWFSDSPLLIDRVTIPKKLGRLTIGQCIQARKCLEGLEDMREGLSTVTAIYLQPLIDGKEFDMLRAIEIEQVILKMPITKVYSLGIFFLKKLMNYGPQHTRSSNPLIRILQRSVRTLRGWQE